MELRHLRYFVAVAEEGSFVKAAGRLRVAQPALSKQIRDLEREVGVPLFERLARGVRVTAAGQAFLPGAIATLESAGRAVSGARGAAADGASRLVVGHGELAVYSTVLEELLAALRRAHPEARVRVSSMSDADSHRALRERQIDVAFAFIAEWPVAGFHALRVVDCATKGVLLPATHPLAGRPTLRLAELRDLTWLNSGPRRWPGFFRTFETALRDRGLIPETLRERPKETPIANVQIAAGEAWALASEAVAAPYRTTETAIVYRPFLEAPIPCWLALVWREDAPPLVHEFVTVARRLGLADPELKQTQVA